MSDVRAIALTGLPGSGKSAVGSALARRLGWPCVDLDDDIAAAAGRPVTAIFEELGEPAFRDLESPTEDVFAQLLARDSKEENSQAEEPKKETALTKPIHLSDIDRELTIRWLLRDYRVVFGGEPISAIPQQQNSFVPNDQEQKGK